MWYRQHFWFAEEATRPSVMQVNWSSSAGSNLASLITSNRACELSGDAVKSGSDGEPSAREAKKQTTKVQQRNTDVCKRKLKLAEKSCGRMDTEDSKEV
jgi:hypothetical protein